MRVLLSVAVLLLGACHQEQALLVTQGSASSSRLDAVYIARGSTVVPVGDAAGRNVSGAVSTDELLTADGRPLGGGVVAVSFTGLLPLIPLDGGTGDASAAVDAGRDAAAAEDAGPEDAAPDEAMSPGTGDGGGQPLDGAPPLSMDGGTGDGGQKLDAGGGPTVGTATSRVTLGQWLAANAEIHVTPAASGFDVGVTAASLIPNGLYSIWLSYVSNAPNAQLFAVAPLDGLPTYFIADANGNVSFTRHVSNRLFQQFQAIPNAISVGATTQPPVIASDTQIIMTIIYHSTGQTNGNASIAASGMPVDAVPPGLVGIIGHVGVDVHPQIIMTGVPSLLRANL